MNLHERLRDELNDRSQHIEVHGAGSRSVIAKARARTKRARSAGVVVALVLVAGVGGVALAVRDTPSESVVAIEDTVGQGMDVDKSSSSRQTGDPAGADPTDDSEQPEQAVSNEAGDVATTEVSEANDAESSDADTDTDTDADADAKDPAQPTPAPDTAASVANVGPKAIAQVAHNGGFVALQEGSSLEFSSNLVTWTAVADPRPVASASISRLASHNGVLYAAGLAPSAGTVRPWLAKSADLSTWQQVAVPAPSDDGSPLTHITNTLYSMDVGPDGIIVTGETVVTLDVAQLLSPAVLAADAWTLGDNQGDLTKIVVYDPSTGSPVEEIDLLAEGVPQSTLDILANGEPTPFVAVSGSNELLESVDTNLDPGTVISGAFIIDGEYIGVGFSDRFASQVLWSSRDAQSWEALPISVIGNSQTQRAGAVVGHVVAFTGQGPILTVQYRVGDDWTEVRLDRMFGQRNDRYVLIDAAFGAGGAVAIAATVDEAQNETLYVLVSNDGVDWTITRLSDIAPSGAQIVGIDSVAVGASAILGFERADSTHERVSLQTD